MIKYINKYYYPVVIENKRNARMKSISSNCLENSQKVILFFLSDT